MICLKDNLPVIQLASGQAIAFERDWLVRSLTQAAARAGFAKWWLAEHVAASVTEYLREQPELNVLPVERLTAADEVMRDLESEFQREIPSSVIGAKVMDKLHGLDEVAYVRYASVYRHFQDIGEFLEEIQSLGRRPKKSRLQPELFK